MGTLRDLIDGAYRLNTVLGQNKRADAAMISNALYALDTMQDSWSNEKLMVYSIKPYIFMTNPGQQVYTMGPANPECGQTLKAIITFNNLFLPGSGYVPGTYNEIPTTTSGNGVDATISIIVGGSGQVTSVTIANPGNNYALADTISFNNVHAGGSGSGFSIAITQVGTITTGPITALSTQFTPGGQYPPGTYNNIPMFSHTGAGSGAIFSFTVGLGGNVTSYTLVSGGSGYAIGDIVDFQDVYTHDTGAGFRTSVAAITLQTDWIIERPMKIEKAYTIWQDPLAAQAVDIPISLLTMEQYASITVKGTTSTFAFGLYDDNSYPTRNITLFPIPLNQVGIRFWLREPLVVAEQSQLDYPIDFPPGYERAFRYNLAVELAPEYMKTVPQSVTATANESKSALKRLNQAPRYKMGDGSLSRRGVAGRWNWITGNFFYGGWG